MAVAPLASQGAEVSAGAEVRLMSPAGYAVCMAAMAVTAGIVYLATRGFGRAGPGPQPRLVEPFVEVPLGRFSRELPPDDRSLARDSFMVDITLRLNPRYAALEESRAVVERRRSLLKDIVWREMIYRLTEGELRQAAVLDTLGERIRRRLNVELGSPRDGQELIEKVLFPDIHLPARR
jgi:hypothetical protein